MPNQSELVSTNPNPHFLQPELINHKSDLIPQRVISSLLPRVQFYEKSVRAMVRGFSSKGHSLAFES